MSVFNLPVVKFSFVLALIGAGLTLGLRPEISGGVRTPVQQHHGNGVAGHSVDALHGGPAKTVAGIDEAVGNWPESTCIRSEEQPAPIKTLWNIGIPQPPERPVGYSALDHCTPIFIAAAPHFDVDLLGGAGMSLEGFYEKTATGGRIEINPNALMEKTERYRAVVLAHEELHAVLEWLDPVSLNEALLPARVVAKARAQLRETGYEDADLDDEILPRLLTHDSDGTGLTGVAEEDQVIGGAMRRLLAQSQTDPDLKRVYRQLQRAHALTHDLMSGKARIAALIYGPERRPSNPPTLGSGALSTSSSPPTSPPTPTASPSSRSPFSPPSTAPSSTRPGPTPPPPE